MKFIEVTDCGNGELIAININSIGSIYSTDVSTVIWMKSSEERYYCLENYEEIKKRIENAYK